MVVRIAKFVILPTLVKGFVAGFRAMLDDPINQSPGLLGMYLLCDTKNPQQYFVQSYWVDYGSLEGFVSDSSYAAMMIQSRGVLFERMRTYPCQVLREERQSPSRFAKSTGIARLSRLIEHPEESGSILESFDRYTDRFTRQQPGCRSVEYFHQQEPTNHYWILSWWETEADLQAFLSSDTMELIRKEVRPKLYERSEHWNLAVAVDDPRRPLSELGNVT